MSAGEAGLAAASKEPRDATSEGAGVDDSLVGVLAIVVGVHASEEETYPSVHNCTSGRTTSEGRGPCSLRYASSSALARASKTASVSASCLLRSRELWAAALLRLIRSMRRCSFSSSVFARFRGGSVVLGSGSSWPQDFLFFAGLLWMMTGGGDACEDWRRVEFSANEAGEGDEAPWRSSILRYWGGDGFESMVVVVVVVL